MEEASAGTIQINLALNLAPLEKGVNDANRHLRGMASTIDKQFKAMGGSLGSFGEQIGNIGKSVKKMFGDEAPWAMQKFGKEAQRALRLSDNQVKALGQSIESLEGAFKLAGGAVQLLLNPLGKIVAAIAAIALAPKILGSIGGFDGYGAFLTGLNNLPDYLRDKVLGDKEAKQRINARMMPAQLQEYNDLRAAESYYNETGRSPLSTFQRVKLNTYKDQFGSNISVPSGAGDVVGNFVDEIKKKTEELAKMFLVPGEKMKEAKKQAEKKTDFSAIEELSDVIVDKYETSINDSLDAWNQWQDAERALTENKRRGAEEMLREHQETMKKEREAIAARWQALGSGNFGTAAGMGGAGGAAFNILGRGAVAQSRNLGTALGGAAEGGSAGGGWGALIGLIVSLLTKTESFKNVIAKIDEWLDAVINALEPVFEPISELMDSMGGLVDGIMELIGGILKFANSIDFGMRLVKNILKLLDSIGLGKVFEAIGKFLGDVGSEIDKVEIDWQSQPWYSGQYKEPGKFQYVAGDAGKSDYSTSYLAYWDKRKFGEEDLFKDEADFNETLERYRAEQRESRMSMETNLKVAESMGDFGIQVKNAELSMRLLDNYNYLQMEKSAAVATNMADLAKQAHEAALSIEVMNSNIEMGYEAYAANRDMVAEQQRITKIYEERYDAEHGLTSATDRAADALGRFSDSLINAAPGFKLAAAIYSNSFGGSPGPGTTGSGSATPQQIIVNVDGQQVAAAIERRQDRATATGAAFASRGVLG